VVVSFEAATVNAESELDHARQAAGIAQGAIVGECFTVAARPLHQTIEMVLADDAKVSGSHRLGVLL
jgi:hypothetical protein